MKIVVLDGYTLNPGDLSWDGLSALGSLTVYDRTPNDKIVERIADAEIVFTNKTPLSNEVMFAAPNIKWIGVLATGFKVVDINAAKQKGIPVCNVPAYATNAVAEMAFSLLLELCHHVTRHSQAVKNGEWATSKDFCFWKYPLVELSRKTMGIIGFGKIGRKTASIAQAFGMNVLVHTNHKEDDIESETLQYTHFETLLAKSDVISLHCSLSKSSANMINKDTIAKMKDGVVIINTSRGGLIDEQALRDALDSGKVSGAGCDVVSTEPIEESNPLLNAKNIIITPHIAWASKRAREQLMAIATNNLAEFLDGNIINSINGF